MSPVPVLIVVFNIGPFFDLMLLCSGSGHLKMLEGLVLLCNNYLNRWQVPTPFATSHQQPPLSNFF